MPVKRPAPEPASPPAPKRAAADLAQPVPPDLGEFVARDVLLLRQLGWHGLVSCRRSLNNINHPAQRLLHLYKHRGVPVKFSTPPWTCHQIERALLRGQHKSCNDYIDFLNTKFVDMISKGQWLVLPYSDVKDLPGLRLSPPGVVPQRERRPRWICDYSWWGVNADTLPLAVMEAMQFGHALDRILREVLLANPTHGPVHLIKVDLSDGFYRVDVNIDDIPKLGVVFPTTPGTTPLVAFPLVLPMGWTNSPPIFSTATETIADLANHRLRLHLPTPPHPLDVLAAAVTPPPLPSQPPVIPDSLPPRDPSLPSTSVPLSYVDVFVDDFIGAAQQSSNCTRVRRTLLHAIDDVFRPLTPGDPVAHAEPVSVKKLRAGDCSWSTFKQVLGWIIDTSSLTIHLPPHRVDRLAHILASIPTTQRRTSLKNWHQILGELRSMSLALPGSRNIFSTMQNALRTKKTGRIALHKGVHDALDDFRWMHADITTRPTRIAELVPLHPVAEGHHDASGTGVWK